MITALNDTVYALILTSNYENKADMIAIYIILYSYRNFKTNLTSHISLDKISNTLGRSRSTTQRAIKALEDCGAIEHWAGDSKGYTNMYAFPCDDNNSTLPKKLKQSSQYLSLEELKEA